MASIRQTVMFAASPKDVYEALMDSRTHSRLTGGKAVISRRVGGKFTAFDGYASGKNLALVPNRKIVQTWRADDWPDDRYSVVTFALRKVKGGTKLTFAQTGVPTNQAASVKQGWIDYYWVPMKTLLAKSAAG